MTRSDFINAMCSRFKQLSKSDVELAVDVIIDAVSETLQKHQRVEIRGFGSFKVNYRPARHGRNPKTGEAVAVPEKYYPHFRPGKGLLSALNAKG